MQCNRSRSSSIRIARTASALACLLTASLPHTALAATDNWTNTSGGNFNTGGNWSSSPTVPGSADIANFNLNATYTVTFTNSPTTGAALIQQGNVTWNANGTAQTYNLPGGLELSGGALTLGSSGALLTVKTLVLSFDTTTSSLTTKSDSSLTSGNIDLAGDNHPGVSGTINDNSTITQTGASFLTVGSPSLGVGILNVNTGGTFTTGTSLTTIATTGQLNISGNGVFNLNGGLTVTGGSINETNGALSWNTSGTTMTIQSGGTVNLVSENATPTNGVVNISGAGSQLNDTGASADLFIDNGGQLSATSGAKVSSPFFDVAFIGNGTATFDGANTSLTASNTGNSIGVAGTGVLTFSTSATGTTGGFIIGQNAGSNGTLNVQSNATVSSGSIAVATSAAAATGAISLTSGGALNMTAGSTLTVGAASGSVASVTIGGGTLATGTGLTTVSPTGQIALNSGTLKLNGDLTVTAGHLVEQAAATFTWAGNHSMTIQSGGFVTLLNQFTTPTNANINVAGNGTQFNLAAPNGATTGGLTVANGGQITVSTGASLSSTGPSGFDSGNGSIIIDGTGSFFNASPGSVIGDFGTFSLTLRNSATSTISYAFVGLSNGSNGTLNVQTGASLSIGGLFIGNFGQGETGAVTLSGGSINMTTGGAVTVGAASNSTANLTIFGGTLNTDPASTTTVNATGVITINGGTLNQTGDITLNGGSLTEPTGNFTWAANHTMTIEAGGKVALFGAYAIPANAVIKVSGAGSQLNDIGAGTAALINGNGSISVTGGGLVHSDQFISNPGGTITVDGVGSAFSTAAPALIGGNLIGFNATASITFSNSATGNVTNGFAIGYSNGTGTLNVQSGAVLTTGSLYVADDGFNGTGNVNVIGGTITQSGSAFVDLGGSSGTGSPTLTIGTAGTFSTGTGLSTINPSGDIHLTGGAFNLNGSLTVNGGLLQVSSGTFTWAANQTMTIQSGGGSGGDVHLIGQYTTPSGSFTTISGGGSQLQDTGATAAIWIDGGALTVTSGGTVHSDATFNVGVFNSAAASFDGVNTTLNAPASNSLVGDFTTGVLTFSNNSTGSLAKLTLGQAVGGNGTLNVLSNATFTLSNSLVLSPNAVASTALANVTGGTLTLTGASTLSVGASSVSTGTVTVGASGTLNTGTGLTTVNATGAINLTGGTFNQNSDITLTGGSFTQTGGTFTWPASHTMTISAGGNVTLLNNYTTPTSAVINISGTGSTFSDTGLTDRLTIDNGASVSVTSGGLLHSDEFLNIGSTGTGAVTVDGAGSALTAGNAQSILGNAGNGTLTFSTSATGNIPNLTISSQAASVGTLNIQSNAALTTGVLNIATNATTATGAINITGGGSLQMSTGATLTVGAASTSSATITIDTGGGFTTSAATTTINPTGKINLLNGSFNLNGNLTVTGGSFTQNGGAFNWAASKTMTIQSGGKVGLHGLYTLSTNDVINVVGAGSQLNDITTGDFVVNNGGSVSVTAGGTVFSDGFVDIASNTGNGTVTIDGANSSLTTTLSGSLLGTSGTGTLTFSNGATGNIGGYTIGTFFIAGGNGTLNVLSNATVTDTGAMNVGTSGNVGQAFVNVTGGTLTQTNSSTLTIGATSNAVASVGVGAGGTYTTSTGLTTINPTGQLNINAGAFNLNGDLTVNGGSLSQISGNFQWAANHTMLIQSGGLVTLLGAYFAPANSNTTVTGANSVLLVPGTSAELGIDFGATLSITSGGTAHSGQFLSIADTGNGTVTVDGLNSSLSAAGSAANGNNTLGTGGIGTLTFSHSATGSIPAGFEIGFNTGSVGILNIQSNASLTTGTLSLANSGLNTVALLNVTGGSLTQSGTSSLIVGDISGSGVGSAIVTIGNAGALTTGTGAVTLAHTGSINLQSGGTFNLHGNMTIASTATFTGAGALNSAANITNSGTFTEFGPQSWSNGTTFTNSGNASLLTDTGANTSSPLSISNTAGILQLGTPQHLNSLFIAGGSASLTFVTAKVLVTSGLTITSPGQLDLSSDDMIVHGGNLTTITSKLKSGFNAGGSYWNGLGIKSSAAQGDSRFLTTLGILQPTSAGTFDSQSYSAGDVLVKYTYYGDADLNGTVNGADYQQIDLGFGTGATVWSKGDFNYDGVVNGSDFALIDNTFNQITATGAAGLAIVASPADLTSANTAAVPEPMTLSISGFGAVAMLGRRRRTMKSST